MMHSFFRLPSWDIMVFNAFTRGSMFSPILLETHLLRYLAETLAAKVYAVASDEAIV